MRRALLFACAFTAYGHTLKPEAQLRRSCTRCHGLNVVRAQRLTREEWDRELDKMSAMGAKIANRSALLDYLAKKYQASSSVPARQ